MPLQVGDQFPKDILFSYVPIDLHHLKVLDPLSCGRPVELMLDELFEKLSGKNLLLVAAPGAFTRMYNN
jgi:alkyl hydroperoxide reductase 1